MARNRYGWQKRVKEIARKEKSDEKMKRRQGKNTASLAEEMPEMFTEGTWKPDETLSSENPESSFRQDQD